MTTGQQITWYAIMMTTTPIDDMDDEYRQGDNCVMCKDEKHFSTFTLQTTLYPIHHAAAVHAANQIALERAAHDSTTGCSFSREELFVLHFAKAYPIHLAKQQKEASAKFNEECYTRMETDPEYKRQCCYYHLDGLHCTLMLRRDPCTTTTTTSEWTTTTPGTY
jgi:hypothetical protein